MPKREDINSILIIGAGPIIIGQACEFDYSGTQACKALKEEGYRIILVNSNPATIMTDPDLAHATYMEPITPEVVAKIIEKERTERPDEKLVLLPTMGGQTALNCALSLKKMGVLDKFDVEMIGAKAEAIDKAEDRELFREAMGKIGLETPRSELAHNLIEALAALEKIGLPAIIRPSFTLGGTGGGIAYNREEYLDIIERGIDASPTNEVLVEESVLGWKEYEMEVVRDKNDNCIIICSIENIDPMGVHTGDSITVAPALTLTDKEYQIMRDASLAVLREIGVETGGSNVQFAVNPADGRLIVIEMNPRVSRSSALASKATGFPDRQGRGAAGGRLHAGRARKRHHRRRDPGELRAEHRLCRHQDPAFRLREIPRRRQPADHLDEIGGRGHGHRPDLPGIAAKGAAVAGDRPDRAQRDRHSGSWAKGTTRTPSAPRSARRRPSGCCMWPKPCGSACRSPKSTRPARSTCGSSSRSSPSSIWKPRCANTGLPEDAQTFRMLKSMGFSDARLADLSGKTAGEVRRARHSLEVRPVYKRIDTCAAEFASPTAYMYSTYEVPFCRASGR